MSNDQHTASVQRGEGADDPLIGTTLEGRYQIEEILGTGGVSVVYKAKQLRIDRYVAVKRMKMQFEQNAVHRERFNREISSLSSLSHPNIVTVYDSTFTDNGQPCVVMEVLKGRSLETLINEEGPLALGRFVRIAVQIAGALEHAHRKGVIHRDLKPGNIVLMDEELDFVKVVDFGLARLREENKRLTQTGEFWGSPAYMSPEQCRGKPGDERSDIYSFGAVMFEMLTGKDPFYDAGSVLDVLHKHGYVEPPAFAVVCSELKLPPALEALVRKCLAKEPADRFQNAREVEEAILTACTGIMDQNAAAQVVSQSQSRLAISSSGQVAGGELPPAQNEAKKNPVKMAALILVPLLVVLGLFFVSTSFKGTPDKTSQQTGQPTTTVVAPAASPATREGATAIIPAATVSPAQSTAASVHSPADSPNESPASGNNVTPAHVTSSTPPASVEATTAAAPSTTIPRKTQSPSTIKSGKSAQALKRVGKQVKAVAPPVVSSATAAKSAPAAQANDARTPATTKTTTSRAAILTAGGPIRAIVKSRLRPSQSGPPTLQASGSLSVPLPPFPGALPAAIAKRRSAGDGGPELPPPPAVLREIIKMGPPPLPPAPDQQDNQWNALRDFKKTHQR